MAPGESKSSGALSGGDSLDVASHLAAMAENQLPLPAALRALALEIPSRKIARALERMAGELERGAAFEEAIQAAGLPPHLAGIFLAGVRSGGLAGTLMQYAEHRRTLAVLRHQMLLSTVYPVFVMAGVGIIVLVASFVVGRAVKETMDDFGVQVPVQTRLLLGIADGVLYLAMGIAASLATMLLFGPAMWRGGWKRLPLIGPVWRWTAQAEFCQLLALLVERGLPLPTALRLTADGLSDPDLVKASMRLAQAVDKGIPLGTGIARQRDFAPTLAPWLTWAEQAGALADGLATAAEMFRARVRAQVGLLKVVLPPIMLVFVGWGVGFVGAALVAPLVVLIRDLSY